MMVRDHECLSCHHEWTAPVVLSKFSPNLSGEATVWCPRCNSRTIMSLPATPRPEAYVCADCGDRGFGGWNCLQCGNHNLIQS